MVSRHLYPQDLAQMAQRIAETVILWLYHVCHLDNFLTSNRTRLLNFIYGTTKDDVNRTQREAARYYLVKLKFID